MKQIFVVFLVLILTACSKFEHTDVDVNPNCELCDWAENRAGFYTGYLYNVNSSGSTIIDTLTFDVQQVFLNQSNYEDSTTMIFDFVELSLENGATYNWRSSARDSSIIIETPRYYTLKMWGDSITTSFQTMSPSSGTIKMEGVFYR